MAAGDQFALHALYERAHRIVFTLAMRITANRETAEEVTIDVFHAVWREASRYDAANGTVLGWIMNHARSRAIDRLRFDNRKKRTPGNDKQPPLRSARAPSGGPQTLSLVGRRRTHFPCVRGHRPFRAAANFRTNQGRHRRRTSQG